jgi:hypothetical protein
LKFAQSNILASFYDIDLSYAGTWFKPWLTHFRKVSTDVSWQALVTNWAQYEVLSPPNGVSLFVSYYYYYYYLLHMDIEAAHCITTRGGPVVD